MDLCGLFVLLPVLLFALVLYTFERLDDKHEIKEKAGETFLQWLQSKLK